MRSRYSGPDQRPVAEDLGPVAARGRGGPRPRRPRRSRSPPRSPPRRPGSRWSSRARPTRRARGAPGRRGDSSTPAGGRPSRWRSPCRPRGRAARRSGGRALAIRCASRLGTSRPVQVVVTRKSTSAVPSPARARQVSTASTPRRTLPSAKRRRQLVDGLAPGFGGGDVEVASVDAAVVEEAALEPVAVSEEVGELLLGEAPGRARRYRWRRCGACARLASWSGRVAVRRARRRSSPLCNLSRARQAASSRRSPRDGGARRRKRG